MPKPTRYFWYIAKANELFCDLDLSKKNLERILLARARLRGAKKHGALDFEAWYPYQSESKYHYHFMVQLKHDLDPFRRILWESRLCDDMYRNNMNFARLVETGKSWSLLITPIERRSYWRPPDFVCECPAKHKADIMRNCPIAQKLNCTLAADHFGNPIKEADNIVKQLGQANKW